MHRGILNFTKYISWPSFSWSDQNKTSWIRPIPFLLIYPDLLDIKLWKNLKCHFGPNYKKTWSVISKSNYEKTRSVFSSHFVKKFEVSFRGQIMKKHKVSFGAKLWKKKKLEVSFRVQIMQKHEVSFGIQIRKKVKCHFRSKLFRVKWSMI